MKVRCRIKRLNRLTSIATPSALRVIRSTITQLRLHRRARAAARKNGTTAARERWLLSEQYGI